MPTTKRQREFLAKLASDLQEALDLLPGRYWAVRSQRESYQVVIAHLRAWLDWTEEDEDD